MNILVSGLVFGAKFDLLSSGSLELLFKRKICKMQ